MMMMMVMLINFQSINVHSVYVSGHLTVPLETYIGLVKWTASLLFSKRFVETPWGTDFFICWIKCMLPHGSNQGARINVKIMSTLFYVWDWNFSCSLWGHDGVRELGPLPFDVLLFVDH